MIKIFKYGEVSNSEIFARENISNDVEEIVKGIVADVIERGDTALLEYTARFDKAELDHAIAQNKIGEIINQGGITKSHGILFNEVMDKLKK